jgi:hypothetical protein
MSHLCPMCGKRCRCKNEDGPGVECAHQCDGSPQQPADLMGALRASLYASQLRDYAKNCPAREDGGPGIEDALCAGADALTEIWSRRRRA